ncbi:MAG: UDP-2,4-diacetamido-2,4,6-trideoxy-beta-L-altropyranose hydrolase [Deltaproteobacteria bacterium]|nr:UDP-2,4-diacetamido-2,4,6-trideoxy-beta-L-altropyranose hydrolase [Deltaproteobacteria bacterium]
MATMKEKRRLIIRADASNAIGSGHVRRCLALVTAFAGAGWECALAIRPGTRETVPDLGDSPCELFDLKCTPAEEAKALFERWPNGCDLLVVDHYERGKHFEASCRPWARNIMVMEDVPQRQHACDFLLDSSLEDAVSVYRKMVPDACKLFLGPDFALLHPQFIKHRRESIEKREKRHSVGKILISFGTVDGKNMCSKAIKSIKEGGLNISVDVVIGSQSPYLEETKSIARTCPFPVKFYVDEKNMARVMTSADLALGACGFTSWERCCLGLPTLAVITAENQTSLAEVLRRHHAIDFLGWHENVSLETIARSLKKILNNHETRIKISRNASRLCDGRGPLRVLLKLLPSEKTNNGTQVRLRLCTLSDTEMIYQWQSDERTRLYFRNSAIPDYAAHEQWIQGSLMDPDRILTLILYDGIPSGVLRLDRLDKEDSWEISIYVDPDKYNQGIGRAALAFTLKMYRFATFFAEVFPENRPSQKLFKSAGFRKVGKTRYRRDPKKEL